MFEKKDLHFPALCGIILVACERVGALGVSREPLIYSAAHLRHIFSRLLLAEKLDVHPVHLEFFAIADEKICTESAPPHSISVSLSVHDLRLPPDKKKSTPVITGCALVS